MTNVLVCVKRSADITGEVVLTDDGTALDGRFSGYAMSEHELCALEVAAQVTDATGGTVTVLTLGEADAVEQLRYALSVGADEAIHIEADASRYGARDVAREIFDLVREKEAEGITFDLILLGNDSADAGNFQTGIRLAHWLDRPVVAGVQSAEAAESEVRMFVDSAEGTETYEVTLPAVACVLEGGVQPRYPSLRGRMRARKAPLEERAPATDPAGSGALGLRIPPAEASEVTILGEGPEAAGEIVEVLRKVGVVG